MIYLFIFYFLFFLGRECMVANGKRNQFDTVFEVKKVCSVCLPLIIVLLFMLAPHAIYIRIFIFTPLL